MLRRLTSIATSQPSHQRRPSRSDSVSSSSNIEAFASFVLSCWLRNVKHPNQTKTLVTPSQVRGLVHQCRQDSLLTPPVRGRSLRQVADRVALAVWERVSPVAISGSNRRPLPEIPLQSRVIKLQLNCPGDPVSAASHHPIVHKTLPRLLKGISPLQGRNLQSSLIHLRARPRCRPPLLLEQTKFQKLCSRKWLLSPTSHTH